ncbi:IS630 family transposase [Streptomyces sp. NRRL S-1314]|uniref:IS630 family transposase n=1 Tax=Streptomyces TaxID=1883 RepID=UPI001F4087E6|nr:IS630 family transposase [Streptomyces sp. NRRL S-1314]
MGRPVRVRGLTEQEGQKLQHIVRRGSTSSVRFRRAMTLLASASGSTVPVIARLVQADEDTVRDLIHKFNEIGLACLDPRWAGGRPHLLDRDDEDFVVQTATTRPTVLGKPFTRWSIRKLADHLRRNIARPVRIGREALRCLLSRRGISFQRTKTWKESSDADFDAKLARIEYAINERPDRTFTFDEFGPLGIRPTVGSCWAEQGRPDRLPATFRRTHGITYFHGCYSVGDDQMWGINRRRKGIDHTWAALRTIRAARPDGAPIYVILDNLSAHTNWRMKRWAGQEQGRAVLHPDLRLLGQPHRSPLRTAAAVHPGQLEPSQPHGPDPGPPRLPALAQPERPPPRRPRSPTT